MNGARNPKPVAQQRNITPNFLKFKRKNSSGKPEEQGLDNPPSNRSGSRGSKGSNFGSIYECDKRVLHLSKLKNNLANKVKETSVEPTKRKIEVTSRRTSSTKREQNQEEARNNLIVLKKNGTSNSNKAIKLGNNSRDKASRVSNPKRNEQSVDKEVKLLNKDFANNVMLPHHMVPSLLQKIKGKRGEKNGSYPRSSRSSQPLRRFLNVDIQLKGEEELKNYEIYAELGKGAFGIVKMGLSKRTNQKVAIKIYQKRRLDEANKIKNLQREINILSKLNHPVIARLLDAIEGTTEIYLIQQYGGANSLYNYLLSKPQHRLNEIQAKQFFKTITETTKYLHERNIVHRDIKAQNILLNRNKELKLIDFGFSLESIPPSTIDTFCGTPTYMAPQIVSKRDHVPIYTDLWSLGIFFFVLLQGNYPFRAKNENDLFDKIRKGTFEYIHKDISERSRHVIERLVRVNPLERMSTSQMGQNFWEWFLADETKMSMVETTYMTNQTTKQG